MKSVWCEYNDIPQFESLSKNIKTDVLIIGGGMAGLLCAYMLDKRGVNYVLLEANRICSGVTKNTTAKITSQHGLIYSDLVKKFGVEKARMYLEANEMAIRQYRKICENIDCDFEEKSAFCYSLDNVKYLEEEIDALSKLKFNAKFTDNIPLPFRTVGAIEFNAQAQFNPLKFVSGISKGLNIYENSKVIELRKNIAVTEKGKVKADKIIVATHFPFINKHGSYFIKMYQQRSYVIAYENAQNVDGMYIDEQENGMSFRNYNNLLLLGGGGHKTGMQGGAYREIETVARHHYKNAVEKYRWATQDCMTLDKVPYIGRYSKSTENFYVATGFNKWGMSSSMAAACILCDEIVGKKSNFAAVFSPSRSILNMQLAVNALNATVNLLTPTPKRCPHLGCALKWNKEEHTWDCPCHGSRFTKDGKLINNPSNDNLKEFNKKHKH